MITPDHTTSSTDPEDNVTASPDNTARDANPVARQGAPASDLVGDTATSPGDKPVRTRRTANESRYAAAPAITDHQPFDAAVGRLEARAAAGPDPKAGRRSPNLDPATESAATEPPKSQHLNVKIEFVVLDGAAAEELIRKQAAAVRDALRWFADHPPDATTA